MGDNNKVELKSFDLRFRHLTAKIFVTKQIDGYLAYIEFPKAYILPQFNRVFVSGIIASDYTKAADFAAFHFKKYFVPLDQTIREIGRFNFVVQRAEFRIPIQRHVGENKYTFIISRQRYCISENVDGLKFPKSTFDCYEKLSTGATLFFINYEKVFHPLHLLGFNHKFIERLLHRYNKIKENRLKLFDDQRFIDEVAQHPEWIVDHVADNWIEFRFDFEIERKLRGFDL